jgi:hypothetical protein
MKPNPSADRENKMKNTLKEQCTNCQDIYLTNMAELQREWVSLCTSCKTNVQDNFAKAISAAYSDFIKVGA